VSPRLPDDPRRAELAAFLRSRRARLHPEQLGLPARRRSRTPGLRREDVAERAGVSTAWYTSLEQARPVHPSRAVVDALAAALCLGEAERVHLFSLTGHSPPANGQHAGPDPALLQQLVDRLAVPAYCTDAATRVLAWNGLAVEVFGDYAAWPAEHRSLLWLLFTESAFAARLTDRDEYAARVVRTFRERSDAHIDDPTVVAAVDHLRACSASFAALWDSHDLRGAGTDTLTVDHPDGRMHLTTVMLRDVGAAGVRLTSYLPADPPTTLLVERLVRRARPRS
jgi:transcriptional regulator with XRE-family HTH domain